jgi:regulator of protease activity HflC (stomatin/prohibitin superfamily)
VESAESMALAITGIVTTGLAMVLGYLGQRWMGAVMLGVGAAFASGLCAAGILVGRGLGDVAGAWIGLLVAIVLAGLLGGRVLGKLIRGQSGRFIAGLWFGYCGLCIVGYLAAGWMGLLTITFPSVAIFWIGLYRISAYILPLQDKSQRPQAFRSLLTFTMGTNYPYYVARDGKLSEHVSGNAFNQFFAGPGIVIAGCDQAGYRTDGIRVLGIAEPGVTFTQMFEQPPKVVDLRPQLCAFDIDALTKDGIPVKVLTFVPFRIYRGAKEAELGNPFPFRRRAIFDAVARQPVERGPREEDEREHPWNTDLIPMVATRTVQDIISRYNVDELCAADDPDRDPRIEILEQMKADLKKDMIPYGIEVLGGGIANLVPKDRAVLERRINNWRTEWVRQILVEISEGNAERKRQIEKARAEAEAEVVLRLGQIVEQCLADGPATQTAITLRFIDCLGEIVSETESQWPPPPDLVETLEQLRGKILPGGA